MDFGRLLRGYADRARNIARGAAGLARTGGLRATAALAPEVGIPILAAEALVIAGVELKDHLENSRLTEAERKVAEDIASRAGPVMPAIAQAYGSTQNNGSLSLSATQGAQGTNQLNWNPTPAEVPRPGPIPEIVVTATTGSRRS